MNINETRQLGIEFERRVQTILPATETASKLDTETIYSFLNQYQQKYVHDIYRGLDKIESGTRLATHVERILQPLLKSVELEEDMHNVSTTTTVIPEDEITNTMLLKITIKSITEDVVTAITQVYSQYKLDAESVSFSIKDSSNTEVFDIPKEFISVDYGYSNVLRSQITFDPQGWFTELDHSGILHVYSDVDFDYDQCVLKVWLIDETNSLRLEDVDWVIHGANAIFGDGDFYIDTTDSPTIPEDESYKQPGTTKDITIVTESRNQRSDGYDIFYDNTTISDSASALVYKVPDDYQMYVRSVSRVNRTFSWCGSDKAQDILPNVFTSQTDVWKLIETPHNRLRILRYPVAVLSPYSIKTELQAEKPTLTIIYDKYTNITGVKLLYYKEPTPFDIMTSTPCELPMDCFDDLVTGAVELYISYVRGGIRQQEEEGRKERAAQRAAEKEAEQERRNNNEQ